MTTHWTQGNSIQLLENGEAFYPAVNDAIAQAREEILLETFILAEDKVGIALKDVLVQAARRGVRITLTVDDYGSPEFSQDFLQDLREAGITLLVFDPQPRAFGMRTNLFRRMHRKLIVIDRQVGFIGGLNFSADHLGDYGPEAKQDYAVRVTGPIVADMLVAMQQTLAPARRRFRWPRRALRATAGTPVGATGATAMALVLRDNDRHRTDIERHYRLAIRLARHEIIIANAYFLPGYRMLRDLVMAAKRGVRVRLILQGQPDMPWVRATSMVLYDYLLNSGVEIHEYCQRPLHGKVAIVDDEWSTVGSSNLDPLSLSLNLEANVLIRDRAFNRELRENLLGLMHKHCHAAQPTGSKVLRYWRLGLAWLMFHFLRRFPSWAGWLPAHKPSLLPGHRRMDGAATLPDESEHQGAV